MNISLRSQYCLSWQYKSQIDFEEMGFEQYNYEGSVRGHLKRDIANTELNLIATLLIFISKAVIFPKDNWPNEYKAKNFWIQILFRLFFF